MKTKTINSNKKRIASVMLASVMAVSAFAPCMSAFADTSGDFEYQVNNGTATITGYTGEQSSITIPNKIGGYSVTAVGSKVLSNAYDVSSVTISEGITTLNDEAFADCSNAKVFSLPSTLKTIGNNAFENCSSIKTITIPNSVTSIGSEAFLYCDDLVKVTLPSGLQTIKMSTFENCSSLKGVTFPSDLAKIDISAFEYCTSLSQLSIPASVKEIGVNAFADCSELKSVKIYNKDIYIDYGAFDDCNENMVIYADGDSQARIFAKTNDIGFSCFTHSYITKTRKALLSANGSISSVCKYCGRTESTSTISKIKSVSLSNTTYTYSGKAITPSVIVKDGNNKTISSKYYKVSYQSGRKNVGKYSVKVTFNTLYSGSKTLTFSIVPKGTSLKSVSASSKGFTANINKNTSQTTGYQLQYSTSRKFSGAKSVNLSNKTTRKKITKLSGKKKYYVRVRTYKTVSGKTYYSSWSSAKSVTTKK